MHVFLIKKPRASRTVPLVSKVCGIPMASIATEVILGKRLSELGLKRKSSTHFGVKEAVFPFNMYHDVDPLLGPEMRSTGEVLGLAGLVGSGRTKLAHIIFGAEKLLTGSMFLNSGKIELKSPGDAVNRGIALLTEDKNTYGIFSGLTVRENITISES